LIVGFGNDFVCNLIGFAWPAYQSVKAIESSHSEDDTKWLMYWVVYALFGLLEFFGDQLLFWIPFYTLTKCAFLLWLMVPGHNGGTFLIYNRLVKPWFLKNESKIDKLIGQGKDAVKQGKL
jgi:receptor expression-enhancing protein 5/6